MSNATQIFPKAVKIEGIPVMGFNSPESLFERLKHEIRKPGQSLVYYLNVHVANTARVNSRLKSILKKGDVVYCDGAGIVTASKMLGQPLPTRLTAADWIMDMLEDLANSGHTVFLLGGEPGVSDEAMKVIDEKVPNHSVIGHHHGYIIKDKDLEQSVIDRINELKPDVLIVGFGTPLQESWIDENAHRLNIPVLYAIGATMDFISGRVSRCPAWMGEKGLEWAYRLYTEPKRLFARYVIGNPWFLGRIMFSAAKQQMAYMVPRPFAPLR